MKQVSDDPMGERVKIIKMIFTEYFTLLQSLLRETPGERPTGDRDATLQRLTHEVEQKLKQFRAEVTAAEAEQAIGAATRQAIAEFERELHDGLHIMTQRIERRTAELRKDQGKIQERLALLKRKKQGAKGYRSPWATQSTLKSTM